VAEAGSGRSEGYDNGDVVFGGVLRRGRKGEGGGRGVGVGQRVRSKDWVDGIFLDSGSPEALKELLDTLLDTPLGALFSVGNSELSLRVRSCAVLCCAALRCWVALGRLVALGCWVGC
jgi:hypothetical protein